MEALKSIIPSNLLGPAIMGKVYLPLIRKSNRKVLVNVSSGLGSFTENPGGAKYATYSITKAGLNMLVRRPEVQL